MKRLLVFLVICLFGICSAQMITFDSQGWNSNQPVGTSFTINGFTFSSNQNTYTNYGFNKDIKTVCIFHIFQTPADYINITVNRAINLKSIAAYQVGESLTDTLILEGWNGIYKRYSQTFVNTSSWKTLNLNFDNIDKAVIKSGNIRNKLFDYNLDNITYTESTVPVELVSFSGKVIKGGVLLNWKTATEINNYGFYIQRSSGAGYKRIGFVSGHGNSNIPYSYSFTDHPKAGSYFYMLQQMDTNGDSKYFRIIYMIIYPAMMTAIY